ncbi:MAG: hypothetical protein V8Q84_12015 [Bilophila sp.]
MNTRFFHPLRLALLALLVLTVQACAPRGADLVREAAPDAAETTWRAYQSYASARASNHNPYRLNASLRYGSPGDTRRVVILLWSNGTLPIRLDVMAGVGALVARISGNARQLHRLRAPRNQGARAHGHAAGAAQFRQAGPLCPARLLLAHARPLP